MSGAEAYASAEATQPPFPAEQGRRGTKGQAEKGTGRMPWH